MNRTLFAIREITRETLLEVAYLIRSMQLRNAEYYVAILHAKMSANALRQELEKWS